MIVDAEKKKETLSHLNEASGAAFKIRNDPRITGVGRFIRRSSLDEFPQLINVLKGEMSLVGPRPEVEEYVERHIDAYAPLLKVRPGITHRVTLMFRKEEEILARVHDPDIFYDRTIMPNKSATHRYFSATFSLSVTFSKALTIIPSM